MPHTHPLPDFAKWPSFPFEGEFRVKDLDPPVAVEPPRKGEGTAECISCNAPDDAYIWISERWRVRAMDRPSGLPMVLILESRSHLDLGDLPNLLAAELGVMTVRLERAVRSLDGVARVHVNRWGDSSTHLHMWFLARPYGRLQLRGTFLPLWDDILPAVSESQWRENLALVAAWLAEFGGRPLAEPPRIQWQAPSNLSQQALAAAAPTEATEAIGAAAATPAEAEGEEDPLAQDQDGNGSSDVVGPVDVAPEREDGRDGEPTGAVSGDRGTDEPAPAGPAQKDDAVPAAEDVSGAAPGNGAVRTGTGGGSEREPAHSPGASTFSAPTTSGNSADRPVD